MAKWYCRLLGLAPEAQAQIFDLYQAVLEASIQRARKEGKYDEGIVDVKGTAITLAQPPQVLFFPSLLRNSNFKLLCGV